MPFSIPAKGTNNKNKDMKKIIIPILALCVSTAIAADVVETTETKTTTTTGTVSEYAPGKTFIVKETSGPVTYRYGTKVTYVTKGGTVLTEDQVRTRIKVGIPVSVQYTTDGDYRVVSRVIVDEDSDAPTTTKTTKTTTTTTTSAGTISEFAPGKTIIVKETSGPVTYRYGTKVTYVTKSGTALTEEQVRTRIKVGIPVSVQYTTDGDYRVVSRVVVDDE